LLIKTGFIGSDSLIKIEFSICFKIVEIGVFPHSKIFLGQNILCMLNISSIRTLGVKND